MIGKNILQSTGYMAFVPQPFPEKELFIYSPSIAKKDAKASLLLGKLDGITQLLADADFFIYMYLRKDAVASSQIEGTRATMMDAIEAEAKIENSFVDKSSDVEDILYYIAALNRGLKRLEWLPLSLRFICENHKDLMEGARKTHFANPGNFRTTQNWINGRSPADAEFVPPPVESMQSALYDLENFLHSEDDIPPLVKAALIHAQFETIHPFLDGNGRTGRMLIVFYLYQEKLIEKPVLYLSSYFKKYKKVYYQRLTDYRENNIEKWVEFFLDGIIEVAESAIEIAREITVLKEKEIEKISTMNKTSSENSMKIFRNLFKQPIVTTRLVQEWTSFNSRSGTQGLIDRFVKLEILEPLEEKEGHGRMYAFKKYLNIFLKDDN